MGFITEIKSSIIPAQLGSTTTNPVVAQVQSALQQLGFLSDPNNDGIFNANTEKALRSFQEKHQLPGNGVINPETVTRLNTEMERLLKKSAPTSSKQESPAAPIGWKSAKAKAATSSLRASTVQRDLSSKLTPGKVSGTQGSSTAPNISPSQSSAPQLVPPDPEKYTGPMPSLPAPPRPTSQLPIQRGRAGGHGQGSLPEQALDLRAQVERSMITEKKVGKSKVQFSEKPIDRISEEMVSKKSRGIFQEYSQAAQKPLASQGPERQEQFAKLDSMLTELSKDKKAGAFFKNEQKLLQDTVKDERLMASSHIHSPSHAMELKRLGMQPSVAGRVGQFTDVALEGQMKALGSGQFNTVYAGKYTLADGKTSFHGVFKAESTDPSAAKAMVDTGIDRENPRAGYRNVATTRLEEALGFGGLTTRSEMAVHKNTLGTVSEKAEGKAAVVLEHPTDKRVPADRLAFIKQNYFGKTWMEDYNRENSSKIMEKKGPHGKEYYFTSPAFRKIDYSDPQLRRDMVRLQLMDSIAGQADRHPGNYFVQLDSQGKYTGLKGIDNDISWGKDFRTFDNSDGHLTASQREASIKLPQYLPPVIDSDAHKSILSLSPKTFQERMGGLLTQDEMSAAAARLKLVQAHISDPAKCKVLKDLSEWSDPGVTTALTTRFSGQHTSYVSREMELQQQFQTDKLLIDFND